MRTRQIGRKVPAHRSFASEQGRKTISPYPALRPDRDKSGDGSSPCSLSRVGIRRQIGCRLPDAILHGKRSLRPRSRAVQGVTAAGFRVRLFSSLGPVVAPPACKPGKDTSENSRSRLHRLAQGQPPLLTARSPYATGLASSLSGCFRSQASGVVFNIAGVLKGFHGFCRNLVSFPVQALTLSRLSASFVWRTPLSQSRQSRPHRAGAQ
jgi:hypothetical protein